MFTGIVEEVGRIRRMERDGDRARLDVACVAVLADAEPGASVAVNGCCLTMAEVTPDGFAADLTVATLGDTALGDLRTGDEVNLERPVATGGRFGGHLVQGHVDGVGTVTAREDVPGAALLTVTAPPEIARYIVAKGSVAVDGTSLTVVDTDAGSFRVALIPYTCEHTTLGDLAAGDRVNLEADVVAKYVERALAAGTETPYV